MKKANIKTPIKGYKAFDENLICRGMQYELGKTYTYNGRIECCKQGFHFCKNIADVYRFYPMNNSTRICEVIALGRVITNDNVKFCTNKIKIVREVSAAVKHCNIDNSTVGYLNSGTNNTGNYNSGNRNTGSGNSGNYNSGNINTGDYNTGDYNTGNYNFGSYNIGSYNSGSYNIGNHNSDYMNLGNYNDGANNIGDYNIGDGNIGCFCTGINTKIKMFDKESNWTMRMWEYSKARKILDTCPITQLVFIPIENMTEEEKNNHPESETTGGYLKTCIPSEQDKQKWWDELSYEDRQEIFNLPNFDVIKFIKCIGITHS